MSVLRSKTFLAKIKQITFELNIIQFYPIKNFFFLKIYKFSKFVYFRLFPPPGRITLFQEVRQKTFFSGPTGFEVIPPF